MKFAVILLLVVCMGACGPIKLIDFDEGDQKKMISVGKDESTEFNVAFTEGMITSLQAADEGKVVEDGRVSITKEVYDQLYRSVVYCVDKYKDVVKTVKDKETAELQVLSFMMSFLAKAAMVF